MIAFITTVSLVGRYTRSYTVRDTFKTVINDPDYNTVITTETVSYWPPSSGHGGLGVCDTLTTIVETHNHPVMGSRTYEEYYTAGAYNNGVPTTELSTRQGTENVVEWTASVEKTFYNNSTVTVAIPSGYTALDGWVLKCVGSEVGYVPTTTGFGDPSSLGVTFLETTIIPDVQTVYETSVVFTRPDSSAGYTVTGEWIDWRPERVVHESSREVTLPYALGNDLWDGSTSHFEYVAYRTVEEIEWQSLKLTPGVGNVSYPGFVTVADSENVITVKHPKFDGVELYMASGYVTASKTTTGKFASVVPFSYSNTYSRLIIHYESNVTQTLTGYSTFEGCGSTTNAWRITWPVYTTYNVVDNWFPLHPLLIRSRMAYARALPADLERVEGVTSFAGLLRMNTTHELFAGLHGVLNSIDRALTPIRYSTVWRSWGVASFSWDKNSLTVTTGTEPGQTISAEISAGGPAVTYLEVGWHGGALSDGLRPGVYTAYSDGESSVHTFTDGTIISPGYHSWSGRYLILARTCNYIGHLGAMAAALDFLANKHYDWTYI